MLSNTKVDLFLEEEKPSQFVSPWLKLFSNKDCDGVAHIQADICSALSVF